MKVIYSLLGVRLNADLKSFTRDGDGENVRTAADLAILGVDLSIPRARIDKGEVFFAAIGALKRRSLFHLFRCKKMGVVE